jgi:photosystem II stability/assembly factor-like uncharacterized protein
MAVSLVMIIAGTALFYSNSHFDKRKKYEKFLREKMAAIPVIPDQSKKNEKAADQPEMGAIQDYFMTLDPALGYAPRERLQKAYKETRENTKNNLKSTASLDWSGTSAEMGGRTRAIMWDPNDATGKKVWAGGVTGGLWYRNDITNNQSLWQPVGDFWSSLNISCITYDPNNPSTFYIGTGEAQTALYIYRESSGTGEGIWKSTDSGQSWNLLGPTLDFEYVTDIKVRNENGSSVIYAGVASGFYHGTNHQSEPSDGLFRSEDGGATWEQVLPDIPGYGAPYAVADIEIAADGRMYVGTMQNVEIEGGATILISDEGTEGTWTVYDDYVAIIQSNSSYYIPARVMLSCAPSDANIVYATIAAGYTDGFNYYRGRYVIKTTNKGATWTEINKPASDWSTLAWHALIIRVDPNNPNHIFTGGLDMWKTTNGGTSWNKISDWSLMYYGGGDEYLHADQHALEFKPGSSTEFICSNDGGVFYTSSATSPAPVFQEKNQGYNTLQFYTCDLYPQAGAPVYVGGLQDNGTLLYQNAPLSIFDMVDGGDGAYCFFDDDATNLLITSVYYNRYSVFLNGSGYDYLDYESGIFINPADYDSKNNTLYANAVDFFGNTPNTILRVSGIGASSNGDFIALQTGTDVYYSHIKVSPASPLLSTHLFIGTQAGQVFKVINAQSSPIVGEITGSDFPAAYVSCVAVGQTEDDLMVTFSNYGVQSVWRTVDGGESWTDVEGNLPDIPVRWAIYHPNNTGQALLATELGVWSTTELNSDEVNWVQDIDGLANVRVDMLILRPTDNMVLAATHGRGFFTAQYPLDPYVSITEKEISKLSVFPNPSSGLVNIQIPASQSNMARIQVFDASGREVYAANADAGIQNHPINLSGQPKGNYIIKMILDGKSYSEKVVVE